jgi:beta-lactam-binding protein with PASTA domain
VRLTYEFVTTRPTRVRVPDVVGLPVPTAVHRLREAGLTPTLHSAGARVSEQWPRAGTIVGIGSAVRLN